jgi:hypothetical protein
MYLVSIGDTKLPGNNRDPREKQPVGLRNTAVKYALLHQDTCPTPSTCSQDPDPPVPRTLTRGSEHLP